MTGATVRALEKSELGGGIRISSLRRAAEAMDCTFVYALVPNRGLERTVYEQALRVLSIQDERVNQTMLLEDQLGEISPSVQEARIQALIASGGLWSAGSEHR